MSKYYVNEKLVNCNLNILCQINIFKYFNTSYIFQQFSLYFCTNYFCMYFDNKDIVIIVATSTEKKLFNWLKCLIDLSKNWSTRIKHA